jgi:4-hydroxy-2-oxoheptanedioate aldolase
VANATEIAAVDGVDVVFVGPRDMSAALGKLNKFDDPELRALIAKVEQATLASGKALGTVAPTAAQVKELFGRGYTFLISGSDMSHLRASIIQMMKDAGYK